MTLEIMDRVGLLDPPDRRRVFPRDGGIRLDVTSEQRRAEALSQRAAAERERLFRKVLGSRP